MERLLLLAVIALSPVVAEAQSRKWLYPLAVTAGAIDAETTYRGYLAGAGRELNPIMRPFVGSRAKLHGAMLGFSVFAVETTMWSKRRGERKWWIPIVVHVGLHSGAATFNHFQRRGGLNVR